MVLEYLRLFGPLFDIQGSNVGGITYGGWVGSRSEWVVLDELMVDVQTPVLLYLLMYPCTHSYHPSPLPSLPALYSQAGRVPHGG